jgi:hypothetical protein
MVNLAIAKWGTDKQRQQWLPRLATGQTIGAFALTEPDIGSDAKHISTTAGDQQDHYRISGQKKWISFGQIADLFLVIARCKDKPTAFLVKRDTKGLEIEPITGVLGGGAIMLARLKFNNCRIPKRNMLGTVGTGFSHLASIALDYGRFSVAWGCVGMAQTCLASSMRYARNRKQFGVLLREHQLVQAMLTDMTVQVKAATLMCKHAALLRQSQDPAAMGETLSAKYFAAKMINAVARDAVQIHGANGLSQDYPVSRFLRDAKAMEIIEGTNQMHQMLIAKYMIHSGI